MKIVITHRPDDAYIEKARKHAEMEEIKDHAAEILENHKKVKAYRMTCFAFFI